MTKCSDIDTVKNTFSAEGEGKTKLDAIEDLYKELAKQCASFRKTLGKKCSEGTGCGDKTCNDIAAVTTGDAVFSERGGKHYATVTDVKVDCRCECGESRARRR